MSDNEGKLTIIYPCDIGWCRRWGNIEDVILGEFVSLDSIKARGDSMTIVKDGVAYKFKTTRIMLMDANRVLVWERIK